jgi:hypothetical protein
MQGFSSRSSLWGEGTGKEAQCLKGPVEQNQTTVKEILKRVGNSTQPAYAQEYTKNANYKIFIHKPESEVAKIEKRKAAMDMTI